MDRPTIRARDLTTGDRLWFLGQEVKPVKVYKAMPGRFDGVSAVSFWWPDGRGGLFEATVGPDAKLELAVQA